MQFDKSQINIAKLLKKVSPIYQNCYLHNDMKLREQFDGGYKALVCFLENYAYERQGSAAAYPKIALKCVSNIYQNGYNWRVPTKDDAKKIWENYKDIAKKEFNLIEKDKKTGNEKVKVNELRNPMYKEEGVIDKLASNNISNIAIYIRDLISNGNTDKAYDFIKSICGIGEKISSFYLRDIVYLTSLDEKNISDLHLLQPIDTWIEQTLKIIFASNEELSIELSEYDIKTNTKYRKKYQKLIVDLSKKSGISSISFNQGAWVLGSQIAGEFETFKKALTNYDFAAQKIIEHHIKEKEEYLREVKNVLGSLRHTSYNSR